MKEGARTLLERQRASGIHPHAFLLWGNDEVKKEEALRYIIAPYVGDSFSSNPNIFEIRLGAEEKSISIDEIRRARRRAFETPFAVPHAEAKNIIIIHSCEAVTAQGASALLKILEEPPVYSVFIAMTNNFYGILPTLRSRFSSFRFFTQDISEIGEAYDIAKAVDDMKKIAEKNGIEEFVAGRMRAREKKVREQIYAGNMNTDIEACERLVEAYRTLLTNPTVNKRLVGEYVALLS